LDNQTKNMNLNNRWLSVDEVAEYLGVKRFTVYKWVKRYNLPAHKIGRLLKFRRSEIDEWVESHETKPSFHQASQNFLQLLQHSIQEIRKFGVRRLGLFGSCVRGEADRESDIDVLVEFRTPSFDNYMELKYFLEGLLGHKVDLVLADSLKAQIKPKIMREVVYVEGL
jgi:excisionase family DNA binding protein